ncbi:MAG: ATP-binding protein [Pirellulales bacterium]
MLKLHAGVSKKVGLPGYSSASASCTIEAELDSTLLQDHEGFQIVVQRAYQSCGQGRKVRFFRVTELITLLMEAKEEKQLLRFRKQIKQLDLIVLDESGYVPTGKGGAELLFDVLSTAYERQSLIVTTNLPFEQWTEVLGSERLTGAALDRLTHRCHILEGKGESFRLRNARRRQRRAAGTA